MTRASGIYATILMFAATAALATTSDAGNNLEKVYLPYIGKCVQETEKLKKLQQAGFQDIEFPVCDIDGSYRPRYYCMWTGYCFCIDRNGKHILASGKLLAPPHEKRTFVDIRDDKEYDGIFPLRKCRQDRAKALDKIKSGARNVELPRCNKNGNWFEAGYYCRQGKCFCVNEYGEKTVMLNE